MQLVDARPEASFNGEATDNIEGWRQGHIKGATNLPAGKLVDSESGLFKSKDEILEIAHQVGLDEKKRTVVMCRTGMAATQALVALRKAGFEDLSLYDGSWSEFGSL